MRDEVREELKSLRAKVVALQTQASDLRERAERIASQGHAARCAVVDRARCTGCTLCEQVCPAGAVGVTYVANIDAERCTGCGICVANCPRNAIHLAPVPTTAGEESQSG
ncbi:MAG: 4Fe-4S binding protein [Candidatus Brocadiaceae bacterium]|jgi:ferredoxin